MLSFKMTSREACAKPSSGESLHSSAARIEFSSLTNCAKPCYFFIPDWRNPSISHSTLGFLLQ